MFLKRFVYVNWGNIPPVEFEFGPVNLFSGGNGSGKTTAADAIQTVMTAAHENLFQFNPGQDETTQRGRGGKRVRTLASYVLGCDDGSYARLDPTDGYLAAVFHPTKGESGEPFTAVIAVRAWLDKANQNVARQDDAQFFILPGVELEYGHFVRDDMAGRRVVALTELHKLLIGEFGRPHVEKYDTKKSYLRRLYAALRGRDDAVPEVEAVGAARAFSRFMAYKPVQSINRFVADEILEPKDLGDAIRDISSQLKTIHGMERDAARLVDSIETLEQARTHAKRYIDQWIELNVLDYTLAQAEYQARQGEYLAVKRRQDDSRRSLKESETAIEAVRARTEQLHDERVSLEAQRRGVDALRQKDELERQRAETEKRLVEQARGMLEQNARLDANVQASRTVMESLNEADLAADAPQVADLQLGALAREIAEGGQDGTVDVHALVQREIGGDLAPLEAKLDGAGALQQRHNRWHDQWHEAAGGESLRERLAALVHQRRARCEQLAENRRRKQQEIERLEAHQVTYPAHVERAIAAIRHQCPAADPRVLCDHVEVTDARWQAAIEGYLGGARFSILVEPKYEKEAARIVRSLPGRDNRARVIQGEKAIDDAARVTLSDDSILHVLDFSHAVARAFIAASYGTVQRVDSTETLRRTRRGVTADGLGSGNYAMFRCDLPDTELVFGASARERARAAKEAELEAVAIEWHGADERLRRLSDLLRAVDALRPLEYADALAGVIATQRSIQKLEEALERLDLSEHTELEQRLEALKAEQQELHGREAELNKTVGEIRNELANLEKEATRLADLQEKNRERVDGCESALQAIAPVWPEFDVAARLDAADAEARDLNVVHAANHRREVESGLHSSERQLSNAIAAHNQQCRPADAIAYSSFEGDYDAALFKAVCNLERDIDRVYNVLKNNILVEKHQQLGELKDAFNNAFVTHLCHAIYQAMNDGQRQIELLNRELEHHRFGADRETFRFDSEWIPEYRDYARFFEEVIRSPALGDAHSLFEADLSKKSRKVLEELMAMLLDDDPQRALRDLERIADYRNYRRYEIYKEVEGKPPIPLSEYGTGSGGQLETPAYIIRAAAITSAFRFAEGDTHLRMVLVDEAFSKMDETRSREVIHYLTESLGLQLLFIMPTSKCGPFMDLISNEFVFAKVPSETPRGELNTRVLVDRKACNQERIRELWANHRRTVYRQAELDFMEEFVEEEPVSARAS